MNRIKVLLNKIPTGILSGATTILILWLTLAPHPIGDVDVPLFPGADKVVHALMFGFLTVVVLIDVLKHRGWVMVPLSTVGIISILCATFGAAIEVAQHFMGLGRAFETLDIMADALGAIAAGGLWAALQKLWTKQI